jgi:hypothetical protein
MQEKYFTAYFILWLTCLLCKHKIYRMNNKKAPQSAINTLKGSNRAIAHTATYKAIVSQSPMKGKAHHGLSRMQYHM